MKSDACDFRLVGVDFFKVLAVVYVQFSLYGTAFYPYILKGNTVGEVWYFFKILTVSRLAELKFSHSSQIKFING